MNQIVIRSWEDAFAEDFIRLSLEWLEKYVCVEPADEEMLVHPHETILDIGGAIYFASSGSVNVGTVSMIPLGEGVYELAKLAVTGDCKGRGIGGILMETALDFAKTHHAKRIILFTNHVLRPAIRLYERFGFREVPLTDAEYESADVKMELELPQAQA